MRLLPASFSSWLGVIWRWIRLSPYAGIYTLLAGLGVVLIAAACGYHEQFTPPFPSGAVPLPKGWVPPPDGGYMALYLVTYMKLFVLVGSVVYHVYLLRAYPDTRKMIRPTWIASGYIVAWILANQLYHRWELLNITFTGQVFSDAAFALQLLLLCALPIIFPILLQYYSRCLLMEKYVLRSFLQPLLFCFFAFFTLWIVMDLLDNIQDFQQNSITRTQILKYYLALLPSVFVTVAPICLLLATVYVLGRMSRTNEIISMLGAGRSLGQILRPIFVASAACAFLGMAANFEYAPVAAGNKQKLLENASEHVKRNVLTFGLMYRNEEDGRTWFIGEVPSDLRYGKMRRVEIRQEDEKGRLVTAWFAKSAFWWAEARTWSLYGGVRASYVNGQLNSLQNFEAGPSGMYRVDMEGTWSETPWILMSGSLTPDFLGVPDLISYLRGNESYDSKKLAPFWTHLFYRFALPWQCIIVVMFAAPLGVVFSRRGLVGGIANAVIIFFALLFLDNLFLNLGRSYRMPAFLAVWMPHVLLGLLGIFLFRVRSQNRELPSFSLAKIRAYFAETFEDARRRFFLQPRLDP